MNNGCLFFQKSIFSNQFLVFKVGLSIEKLSLILDTALATSETIATSTDLFLLTSAGSISI